MGKKRGHKKAFVESGKAEPVERPDTTNQPKHKTLYSSEALQEALFRQSSDTIMVIKRDGSMVAFNTTAHKNLGYTREEFEKLKIKDIEAVESPDEVRKHIGAILEKGVDHFETKHRTKSGEIRDIVVTTQAILFKGDNLFVAVIRDITEEKETEASIKQKDAALREIMSQIQHGKDEIGRQIQENLEKIVGPLLRDIRQNLPSQQQAQINMLEISLKEITSPFTSILSHEVDGLTPIEIRICWLIRSGMSTKEIARMRHISPATVRKHRENIRRKLDIQGKDISLTSHLNRLLHKKTEQ